MERRTTVYHKIVPDNYKEIILPENLRLIDDFTDYLHAIDRSPNTIFQYEGDLKIFFTYNAMFNENKRFTEITKREFAKFQSYVLSVSGVDNFAEEITDILGKPFYFHCLRHQLCTRLFKIGLPAHVIKEYFGWAGLEMTNIYNDNDASDLFGKYFTKEGIKGA